MAETTMNVPPSIKPAGGRTKFLVGGIILLAAVVFLIVTNLKNGAEYYTTVNDIQGRQGELVGRNVRVIGVVLGDTIEYDGHELSFEIAHVPDSAAEITDEGGLAEVLHTAVSDPNAHRIRVVLYDEPKPDLLRHEAQAIVTGTLGDDGVFYANELLLKCPTRYQEEVPQAQ